MVTPEIRNIVLIALFQQIMVHLCNGGRFLVIASNMETLDAQALRYGDQLRKTRIDPFFSLRLLLRPANTSSVTNSGTLIMEIQLNPDLFL